MRQIEHEAAPIGQTKANESISNTLTWIFILFVALCECVMFVFIALKLFKIVAWTWPVTLIPLWILLAIVVTGVSLVWISEVILKHKKAKE